MNRCKHVNKSWVEFVNSVPLHWAFSAARCNSELQREQTATSNTEKKRKCLQLLKLVICFQAHQYQTCITSEQNKNLATSKDAAASGTSQTSSERSASTWNGTWFTATKFLKLASLRFYWSVFRSLNEVHSLRVQFKTKGSNRNWIKATMFFAAKRCTILSACYCL